MHCWQAFFLLLILNRGSYVNILLLRVLFVVKVKQVKVVCSKTVKDVVKDFKFSATDSVFLVSIRQVIKNVIESKNVDIAWYVRSPSKFIFIRKTSVVLKLNFLIPVPVIFLVNSSLGTECIEKYSHKPKLLPL